MKKVLPLLFASGIWGACNKTTNILPANPTPTPQQSGGNSKQAFLIYDSTAYRYNPSEGYVEESNPMELRDSLLIDTASNSKANFFWVLGQDTFWFSDTVNTKIVAGKFMGRGWANQSRV